MAEPSKVIYKELKIRYGITEAIAVADVVFDCKAGTVEILGLPPGLNMDDISTSSEKAYTDIESIVDPTLLGRTLKKNPEVTVIKTDGKKVEGKLLGDYETKEGGLGLIEENGTLHILPNERAIDDIVLKERLRAEPLLKVTYSKENEGSQIANITIKHLLSGLSFSNIVYELDFGDNKLGISPFVYVSNNSPLDFKEVKLTLVMPEKASPKGDKVIPEVGPIEQYLRRSEDIRVREMAVRRAALGAFAAGAPTIRRARAAGGELAELALMGEETEPIETIEGSVATVDTEGKYSLSQGENKRARLKGTIIDGYHRTNVLLINPNKYEESGMYFTSVVDAVRFTPNTDLKAGSFYFDGQQLQFPAMKKDQEYELNLRTVRNLEAEISKDESSRRDERQRQIITTTYNVKLTNNTGDEQKVEINIPIEAINKAGAEFIPELKHVKYEQKTIAGEQYQVANVTVGARGTVEFKFNLKTR